MSKQPVNRELNSTPLRNADISCQFRYAFNSLLNAGEIFPVNLLSYDVSKY